MRLVICQSCDIPYLWHMAALAPLEAKSNEDAALQEKIEEAIFWFEKFLGFQILGQDKGKQSTNFMLRLALASRIEKQAPCFLRQGVKFVFNKIDPQSPEKEYSFCINLDRDRYNCELQLFMRFGQVLLLIPNSPFFTFTFFLKLFFCHSSARM